MQWKIVALCHLSVEHPGITEARARDQGNWLRHVANLNAARVHFGFRPLTRHFHRIDRSGRSQMNNVALI